MSVFILRLLHGKWTSMAEVAEWFPLLGHDDWKIHVIPWLAAHDFKSAPAWVYWEPSFKHKVRS